MADHPHKILFSDPLGEVTRKERRMLLLISAISILIAKTGLIPNKLTALGIEFSASNKEALLWVIILVILYFIAAFVIYGISDLFLWRTAYYLSSIEETKSKLTAEADDKTYMNDWMSVSDRNKKNIQESIKWRKIAIEKHGKYIDAVAMVRLFFEFFIPIIVSLYSIKLLLNLDVSALN